MAKKKKRRRRQRIVVAPRGDRRRRAHAVRQGVRAAHQGRHHRPRRRRRRRAARAHRRRAQGDRRRSSGAASSCRARRPTSAREIALDLKLPPSVEAMTVTRACASGLQAITTAAAAIERGDADVMIAGGSRLDVERRDQAAAEGGARDGAPGLRQGDAGRLPRRPRRSCGRSSEILPQRPKIAERTTGEVMGEAADKMARRNEMSRAGAGRVRRISRTSARRRRSPRGASPARSRRSRRPTASVHDDNLVRADTSVEKLAKLRPVFASAQSGGTRHRRQRQSPLTDGARGGAAHERGQGQGARADAAGGAALVGLRRRRPGRSAADRAGAGDAQGARPRRPDARRRRLRRHARGVRRAGAERPQDARLEGVRREPPRPRRRRSARSIRRGSTCTAARSRSATRSAPPARAS